jgi:hypothetical protein
MVGMVGFRNQGADDTEQDLPGHWENGAESTGKYP